MDIFGKTAVFPGGYGLIWGYTTWADMAGLGSIAHPTRAQWNEGCFKYARVRFALRILFASLLFILVTNISLMQNITTQTTQTVTFAYMLLPKA